MYQGGKIQQIEWDMATITAGDYSVEFRISAENYRWFHSEIYRAPDGPFENKVSPALALKTYLAKEIEEKLDAWAADNPWALTKLYGKKKTEKSYGGTKVADIVFSFNNARLIEALRARGGKIATQKFDDMRAEEVKINALFTDFDALTVPTSAFVTFESDDSANLALLVENADANILN